MSKIVELSDDQVFLLSELLHKRSDSLLQSIYVLEKKSFLGDAEISRNEYDQVEELLKILGENFETSMAVNASKK